MAMTDIKRTGTEYVTADNRAVLDAIKKSNSKHKKMMKELAK